MQGFWYLKYVLDNIRYEYDFLRQLLYTQGSHKLIMLLGVDLNSTMWVLVDGHEQIVPHVGPEQPKVTKMTNFYLFFFTKRGQEDDEKGQNI